LEIANMSVVELPVVGFEANGCALDWYGRYGGAAQRKKDKDQDGMFLVA
jgi:hypothetical protein